MSHTDFAITLYYLRDSYHTLFGKEIPNNIPICEFLEKEFPELYEVRSGYMFEISPISWSNKAQNEMIKKFISLSK
jgi:hypothetical protein